MATADELTEGFQPAADEPGRAALERDRGNGATRTKNRSGW